LSTIISPKILGKCAPKFLYEIETSCQSCKTFWEYICSRSRFKDFLTKLECLLDKTGKALAYTSILGKSVIYGQKKFYNIGPWTVLLMYTVSALHWNDVAYEKDWINLLQNSLIKLLPRFYLINLLVGKLIHFLICTLDRHFSDQKIFS
jgi:hypothetical protein